MKVKVNEAVAPVLDWMVAKADQPMYSDKALIRALTAGTDGIGNEWDAYSPSTNWAQGGPIIERKKIDLYQSTGRISAGMWENLPGGGRLIAEAKDGPSPLIAAMRCYVVSELGEEVDVPEELI